MIGKLQDMLIIRSAVKNIHQANTSMNEQINR